MKNCLVVLLCSVVCAFAPAAFAGNEGQPKVEKKAEKDAAKVIVSGRVIEIGPDGKVKVQPLGGETGPKSKKPAGPDAKADKPEVKVETLRLGKVITVGPDGKIETRDFNGELPKEVLDKLPKELRDQIAKRPPHAGKIGGGPIGRMKIVVDKNGQRHEFEADIGADEAFKLLSSGHLDEVLKRAGDDLPPEAKEALKAASQSMKAEDQKVRGPAKGQDEISAKLDKILDRLERLEGDVKALKTKTDESKDK
jgi:hypothetical protein